MVCKGNVCCLFAAKHRDWCPWWDGGLGLCVFFALFVLGLWSCGRPSCSLVLFFGPWRSSCFSVWVFLFGFFRSCSSGRWLSVLCFPFSFFRSLLSCSCSSVPVLLLFLFFPLACPFIFSATSLSTTTRLFEPQILPFCDFFSFIIPKSFLFYLF